MRSFQIQVAQIERLALHISSIQEANENDGKWPDGVDHLVAVEWFIKKIYLVVIGMSPSRFNLTDSWLNKTHPAVKLQTR